MALAESDAHLPINIGNPKEFTLLQLAETVIEVAGSRSEIIFEALPVDDPKVRQPDITKARELLGWEPEVELSRRAQADDRRVGRRAACGRRRLGYAARRRRSRGIAVTSRIKRRTAPALALIVVAAMAAPATAPALITVGSDLSLTPTATANACIL